MKHLRVSTYCVLIAGLFGSPVKADDWSRFRGPDGAGISADTNVPITWSESENLKWKTPLPGAGSSSPIVVGDRIFVTCFSGEGQSLERQLVCIDRKDGTIWSTRNSSYVATPILHEGHLYWVDDREQAFCVEAKSGDLVYRERLKGVDGGGRPFYASPVLANGKLYVVSRWSGTFVFVAKPSFEQIAQNKFQSDESDFSATPAISNGELFLRSGKFVYCIASDDNQ